MVRKPSLSIDQVERLEKSGVFMDKDEDETPKKDKREEPKEFTIHRRPDSLWVIKLSAGGRLPDILSGAFTTPRKAQEFIDSYIEQRNNAKATG